MSIDESYEKVSAGRNDANSSCVYAELTPRHVYSHGELSTSIQRVWWIGLGARDLAVIFNIREKRKRQNLWAQERHKI